MSNNKIKPLVDVKPPRTLQEIRADLLKMVKDADGWDWEFKRITLDLGMKTLTSGRVLYAEPCEACGDGESKEDIFFSDLLLLVELAYNTRFTYVLLIISTDPDKADVEVGFSHMHFSSYTLHSVPRYQVIVKG